MTRETMAEGVNSPDQEPKVVDLSSATPKPFEKGHIPGMGHLVEDDNHTPPRTTLSRSEAEVKAAQSPFTPEHPFSTLGTLPKANIRPEQIVNLADDNQNDADQDDQEEVRRQELEAAKRTAEEAKQRADQLQAQLREQAREQARQQEETKRQLEGVKEALRQQAEAQRRQEEARQREEQERERQRQEREQALKDQVTQAQTEAARAVREAEAARRSGGSGGGERWVTFGPFGLGDSVDEIRDEAKDKIGQELADIASIFSEKDELVLARLGENLKDFRNLRSAKTKTAPSEIPEIANIERRFRLRWVLGVAAAAAEKGMDKHWGAIVGSSYFKEAFKWSIGAPEGGAEKVPGVREGIEWVETDEGKCFREHTGFEPNEEPIKPDSDDIIERIAQQLQKTSRDGGSGLNPEDAKLAATLTYQIYVSTGEVTKWVGPIKDGQLVDQAIMDQVFPGNTPVDMSQGQRYWRYRELWKEEWRRPEHHYEVKEERKTLLSGILPYLWAKVIFTPEFLAGPRPLVNARELIPDFNLGIVSLTRFKKVRNLLELNNLLINKDLDDFSFSGQWSGLVGLAVELSGKLKNSFLLKPVTAAGRVIDVPDDKIKEAVEASLKSFYDLKDNFEYLGTIHPLYPERERAFLLHDLLYSLTTPQGKQLAGLRNEMTRTERSWGAREYYYAIKIAADLGVITSERADELYKATHASFEDKTEADTLVGIDKGITGGIGKWVYDNLIKPIRG